MLLVLVAQLFEQNKPDKELDSNAWWNGSDWVETIETFRPVQKLVQCTPCAAEKFSSIKCTAAAESCASMYWMYGCVLRLYAVYSTMNKLRKAIERSQTLAASDLKFPWTWLLSIACDLDEG